MHECTAGGAASENFEGAAAQHIDAGADLAARNADNLSGTDAQRAAQDDVGAGAAVRGQKEAIGGDIRAKADEIGAAALDDLQEVSTRGECRAGAAVERDRSKVDLIAGAEAADE